MPFCCRGLLLGPRGVGWAYPCGGLGVPCCFIDHGSRAVACACCVLQTLCLELGLHSSDPVLLGRWSEGPRPVFFVDGAHDGLSWRMGGCSEFLGVRSVVARRLRSQGQQLLELQSLGAPQA